MVLCARAGLGCVYHLEECTVFGDVKSSPQWSGVVQTHAVLLDGPEIPHRAPRGKSQEFKRFYMRLHSWGSNTAACVRRVNANMCLSFSPLMQLLLVSLCLLINHNLFKVCLSEI